MELRKSYDDEHYWIARGDTFKQGEIARWDLQRYYAAMEKELQRKPKTPPKK